MKTMSQVLREPIINWLVKSEVSKKELSQALSVSRQTPTDWTKDKPAPVTPENSVRLAEYANDTELTMSIIYQFFGVFRPMDGDLYRRPFHSINVSKFVARKLAKLVFNEGCKISADDDKANEFLQSVFKDNKFRKNFGEELEAGYAISGLVLRPYFDPNTNKIKISFVRSDCFYPLQSNSNDISEAAIANIDVVVENGKPIYYTLLRQSPHFSAHV